MTIETVVYLPESVHGLRINGPAVVVLDRVRSMTHCDYQGCSLSYRGERVASLLEWLQKAGLTDADGRCEIHAGIAPLPRVKAFEE